MFIKYSAHILLLHIKVAIFGTSLWYILYVFLYICHPYICYILPIC